MAENRSFCQIPNPPLLTPPLATAERKSTLFCTDVQGCCALPSSRCGAAVPHHHFGGAAAAVLFQHLFSWSLAREFRGRALVACLFGDGCQRPCASGGPAPLLHSDVEAPSCPGSGQTRARLAIARLFCVRVGSFSAASPFFFVLSCVPPDARLFCVVGLLVFDLRV